MGLGSSMGLKVGNGAGRGLMVRTGLGLGLAGMAWAASAFTRSPAKTARSAVRESRSPDRVIVV
ncbi:hypothetical protein DI270_001490 [Microbispora triticiradicis]|uniref:Uncharacterized protein n=1 Tax=Microbispora triticiradicis TaxID=2200763 RepID=A0ABX9LS13_9ACTN|nr:hypothetical protein DI270_001490 [Microbispora triticiradicis]